MSLQEAVDEWILRHENDFVSWEGTISEEHGLSRWLPGYNEGVYIVGEYACVDCGLEGCTSTPAGFLTCRPRIKIGLTNNMYQRIANLHCHSSREFEIMALMPFDEHRRRVVERELHSMFKAHRIDAGRKTEWFWNTPELEGLAMEAYSCGAEYFRASW
jgi:hypothetical protein